MSTAPPRAFAPPADHLTGPIERVTFHNVDSGFCVLQIHVKGERDLVTVVGTIPEVRAGEWLDARGRWAVDSTYGRQFRAEVLKTAQPDTAEGMEKYLGSGLVKGVGPTLAKRLVARFGTAVFEAIERTPHQLLRVDGIGKGRQQKIVAAWQEQRAVREIMLFLHSHGVGTGRAFRIYKTYGEESIAKVREDPYRLARDIWGIGFKTADAIARSLGIAKDSDLRARAGVEHVLHELTTEGHCAFPRQGLVERAAKMLEIGEPVIESAVDYGIEQGRLTTGDALPPQELTPFADCSTPSPGTPGEGGGEGFTRGSRRDRPTSTARNPHPNPLPEYRARGSESTAFPATVGGDRLIYLAHLDQAERRLAEYLRALAAGPHPCPPVDVTKAVEWVEQKAGFELAAAQREAIGLAIKSKVLVITGGPGVGKTTLVNSIVRIFRAKGLSIVLCAPTGRAAKRLSETVGMEASTVHRLLEFDAKTGDFKHNQVNPLDGDVFVVDETSMVDLPLAHKLVRAIPPGAALILVGDVDQLPPVGPGSVLRDVIESGVVPVCRLTEVFRQAAQVAIITGAHRVNQGLMPVFPEKADDVRPLSDLYFVEAAEPEVAADAILRLVKEHIPRRFGLHPLDDIQVLSPMQRGALGAELNVALQAALNPPTPGRAEVERYGWTFRPGDKVMQTANDYDKDVFNGDIGRILAIDDVEQEMRVRFDQREVVYDLREVDELTLSYATTVHKSQGSEYPAVVIPVHTQHFPMLQRNLIYTAMTRGKRLVVLVGTRKAIGLAVKRLDVVRRVTTLAERLRTRQVDG